MSAATPAEIMARLDAGQDPELAKLVRNRAEEEGVTPMVALVKLLLGRRAPVDPELFSRTAPAWNCVDYPHEGMHYLAADGSCRWCGEVVR